MTPRQIAKEHCANYQSDGSCLGVHYNDDLKISHVAPLPRCLLADPIRRCPYFEECVMPMKLEHPSRLVQNRMRDEFEEGVNQDICEPLLAIADMAEGDWPQSARVAVTKLCAQEEDASNGVKLLSDIKAVFDKTVADRLPTEQILGELVEIEDSPWAIWWQDDLRNQKVAKVAARLARMLKVYKRPDGKPLKPRTIRIGDETPKGFHRSDFEQAWSRYLPAPCETAATSATAATHDATNVAVVADVASRFERADGFHTAILESDIINHPITKEPFNKRIREFEW